MDWNEMIDVLSVVTISDGRRTFVELDVAWWLAQANYAEWPGTEFAIAAIMKHTADHPDKWLSPGHITGYWRQVRNQAFQSFNPPPPSPAALDDPAAAQREAEVAFDDHVRRAVEAFIDPMRDPMNRLRRSISDNRARRRELQP